MTDRIPAEVFPPGEFIVEELEARGWAREHFAALVGWPPDVIADVLDQAGPISPEASGDLARVFGCDPRFFLNLDAAYRRGARQA